MTTANEPLATVFASRTQLSEAFEAGLRRMLDEPVLGAFILALANASFDAELLERLRVPLGDAFAQWCARFDRADPLAVQAAADDVSVFLRLRASGLDRLRSTRWRDCGPWQLQYNGLRGFRPPRMSHAVVDAMHKPFDPDGFHFNKPFLRREVFWEGELLGQPVRLLYNKFPFAELHGLLVPEPAARKPQYLSARDHQLIWRLGEQLGGSLAGLGFAYNAYGAFASVNHLHFQMYLRRAGGYPIEAARWAHNGGSAVYPLDVMRYADAAAGWECLARLQNGGYAFNLLYRPGALYVVERRRQGRYPHSDWTAGFAWSEVAGALVLSDEGAFDTLGEQDIEAEFCRLALRP